MDETARKRRTLIAACLSYEASALHDEDHPENPYGDAEMELHEDILNKAVWDYCELFAQRPDGAFEDVAKAAELLAPGGAFAEVSPSGAELIRAELKVAAAARTYVWGKLDFLGAGRDASWGSDEWRALLAAVRGGA